MIAIRRARPTDALGIAEVHVEAWQDTYPSLLPPEYLASLNTARLARQYAHGIQNRLDGHAIFVAEADAVEADGGTRIVGFASGGRARRGGFADGEVHTLYVLSDFQDRRVGRRLLRAMATHLSAIGCHSVMLWVLAGNPSLWFYRHLGGRPVLREPIRVGGTIVEQVGIRWEVIDSLLAATAPAREG
ncbi:GNAT family N-acetyltransferase [Acetobacteraceae bacterium H6797]|nr:GNAT family N-acetyltransferase [Acetobacteraceae bacterium H6797]